MSSSSTSTSTDELLKEMSATRKAIALYLGRLAAIEERYLLRGAAARRGENTKTGEVLVMASDNELPIGANVKCMVCENKWEEKYDPPITLNELYNKIGDCTECGSTVIIKAVFAEDANCQSYSLEEWRELIKVKYWNLKKTADDNFPGLWFSLEFQLSIKRILNIKECTLPLIGIILGPPGSQKTLGMELERNEKDTYYSDGFSVQKVDMS